MNFAAASDARAPFFRNGKANASCLTFVSGAVGCDAGVLGAAGAFGAFGVPGAPCGAEAGCGRVGVVVAMFFESYSEKPKEIGVLRSFTGVLLHAGNVKSPPSASPTVRLPFNSISPAGLPSVILPPDNLT